MKVILHVGRLDCNHHGRRYLDAAGKPAWETRRSGFLIVPLGRDGYFIREGRRLIGWRIWIYRKSGACTNYDAALRFDRSPYRPPSKYAPQPDWKPPT